MDCETPKSSPDIMQVNLYDDHQSMIPTITLEYSSGLTQTFTNLSLDVVDRSGPSCIDLGPIVLRPGPHNTLALPHQDSSSKVGQSPNLVNPMVVVGCSNEGRLFGYELVNGTIRLKWQLDQSIINPNYHSIKLNSIQLNHLNPGLGRLNYSISHSGQRLTDYSLEFNVQTGNQESNQLIQSNPPTRTTLDEWAQNIIGHQEAIVGIVEPNPMGSIASVGRVLGDRTTIFKYLNPHLIGIITTPTNQPDHALVYLVDQTSSEVVHKVLLDQIIPSTVLVMIDHHRVIISATRANQLAQATTITSIELYNPLPGTSQLVVLSRTFISPEGLRIATATQTNARITTTNFICKQSGLTFDQSTGD